MHMSREGGRRRVHVGVGQRQQPPLQGRHVAARRRARAPRARTQRAHRRGT